MYILNRREIRKRRFEQLFLSRKVKGANAAFATRGRTRASGAALAGHAVRKGAASAPSDATCVEWIGQVWRRCWPPPEILITHRSQSLLSDVVEDEGEGLGLLAVALDGDGAGTLDLSGGAFLVVVAVAEPFAEVHPGVNFDQGDVALLCHGLHAHKKENGVLNHLSVQSDDATYSDKLLVLGILAVGSENGTKSLLSIEGLQDLIQSLDKSYTMQKPSSIMPSIPVQIRALACSRRQTPVPTVIRLRLLDHTLDGIIDVVGLDFLLNFDFRHLLLATFRQKASKLNIYSQLLCDAVRLTYPRCQTSFRVYLFDYSVESVNE